MGSNYNKEGKISIKSYRNSFMNVINLNGNTNANGTRPNTLRKSRHLASEPESADSLCASPEKSNEDVGQ